MSYLTPTTNFLIKCRKIQSTLINCLFLLFDNIHSSISNIRVFSFYAFPRPFVEFISAPFWSVVSTRFRQAKNILIMALFSWIVFTVAIGLINPPPHSCWREMNATHQLIERVGYKSSTINPNIKNQMKRSVITLPTVTLRTLNKITETIDQERTITGNQTKTPRKTATSSTNNQLINTTFSVPRRLKMTRTTTTSTTTKKTIQPSKPNLNDDDYEDDDIEDAIEDDPIVENRRKTAASNSKQADKNQVLHITTPKKTMGNPLSIKVTNLSLVKPLASPILYEQKDVRNVFMVLLLIIIIGEFFSAPAITLAVRLLF